MLWLWLFPGARRLHRLNAVDCPVGAQKKLPAQDGGRGVEVGAVTREVVLSDELEFGFGRKNEGTIPTAYGVNAAVREHGRGVKWTAAPTGAAGAGKALFIDEFAGLRLHAQCEALVAHDKEVAAMHDWRRYVRGVSARPQDVGLRDIPFSACSHRDAALPGKSARRVNHAVRRDDAGRDIAVNDHLGKPAQFPRVWIQAPQFAGHGEDEVRAADFAVHQHRRAEAEFETIRFGLPDFFSGQSVKRAYGATFLGGVHDDGVLVDNWTRARTPAAVAGLLAEIDLPKLLAVEVERQRARLAEEDIDPLAVRDGRAAGVAVLSEVASEWVFRQRGRHCFVPQYLSRPALKTDKMALEILRTATTAIVAIPRVAGDEQAFTPDNRAGRTRSVQCHLPLYVLCTAPGDGRFCAGVGNGGAVGPTESWPIRRTEHAAPREETTRSRQNGCALSHVVNLHERTLRER